MNRQAPLNWLRSFEAAARLSSFTRAASELNLTQAAVSKQIKALENHLNCQLFKRQAHGLNLTEQGRRYWLDTHHLVEQLDKVTSQFYKRQQHNKIHIRCNISYSLLVLGRSLLAFQQLHPGIEIEITHDIWSPEKPSDNAHLEIGYQLYSSETTSDYSQPLGTDKLFPVIAPDIADDKIPHLPLIHVSGYYLGWRWWCEQVLQQLPPEHINQPVIQLHQQAKQTISVDNSAIAYELAAQGLGIALGRTCLTEPALTDNKLRRIDQHCELEAQEGFVIRLSPMGQHNTLAQSLYAYLVA